MVPWLRVPDRRLGGAPGSSLPQSRAERPLSGELHFGIRWHHHCHRIVELKHSGGFTKVFLTRR
jgi:hypothetical protein